MKTLTHKHNTARCKLSLPYFEAESKEESCAAKLMNRFTSKLEEKIISYANDIKHGTWCCSISLACIISYSPALRSPTGRRRVGFGHKEHKEHRESL